MKLEEVLTCIISLREKGIIDSSIEKKGGRQAEYIILDKLYEKLAFIIIGEEKKEDKTVYGIIENEFARPLAPMEYNLVSAWLDNGYSSELITEALKEAVYNNAKNLKYIDKILDTWHNKGIKTKEDVIANKKNFKERKQVKGDNFDYDWLNDEE